MSRCPRCGGVTATGCTTLLIDSDTFNISGDGSEASEFTAAPILDADPDNLLTCGVGSGLLGKLTSVFLNPPAVCAYRTTNLTVTNNTMTAVNLDAEEFDTDTMHSTSANTNRLTINTDGVYHVTFQALWYKNITGNRVVQVRKNGTDILAYESKKTGGADLYVGHSLSFQEAFVATDYIEAMVLQTSGGDLRLVADLGTPSFAAARIP